MVHLSYTIFLPRPSLGAGWIQTLDLRIVSQVVYHCANEAQSWEKLIILHQTFFKILRAMFVKLYQVFKHSNYYVFEH